MLLIHVISIHVLLIDVFSVQSMFYQSSLYLMIWRTKGKIEITRENDGGGVKKHKKILSLSPSSFFDLLSYETPSCDQATSFPGFSPTRLSLSLRRAVSQRFGHPRVLGIPIPKSLAFWASPSHITAAFWASPGTLPGCPNR